MPFFSLIFVFLLLIPVFALVKFVYFLSRFIKVSNVSCCSNTRFKRGNDIENCLLHPLRECNLQLFALISIWISSKIHNTSPLSIKSLKSLGDEFIKEQHFTTRDFLEAEVIFMQVLDFEIGASNIAFIFLEELLIQFRELSRIGDLVKFEACINIMDLLYETEDASVLYSSPRALAAAVLVASYVITAPKQQLEFPLLPWSKTLSNLF
ncbi:hypothetical protein GIB67_020838 [Kingdonia uniflora]|uniref:Cyclin N-terminal domain-containing protein n=1 Tax=Kingdonia uniflora TaxID=39325 RepID=A0A7J7M7A2_9MAGN|nr:hypothetical protein GIB67_020838 [Kingdonia uniflora]